MQLSYMCLNLDSMLSSPSYVPPNAPISTAMNPPVSNPNIGNNTNEIGNPLQQSASSNSNQTSFSLPIVKPKAATQKEFVNALQNITNLFVIEKVIFDTYTYNFKEQFKQNNHKQQNLIVGTRYLYYQLSSYQYENKYSLEYDMQQLHKILKEYNNKLIQFGNVYYYIIPYFDEELIQKTNMKIQYLSTIVDKDTATNSIKIHLWLKEYYPIIDVTKIDFKASKNYYKLFNIRNSKNIIHKDAKVDFNKQYLSYPEAVSKLLDANPPIYQVYMDTKPNKQKASVNHYATVVLNIDEDSGIPYGIVIDKAENIEKKNLATVVYGDEYTRLREYPVYFKRTYTGIVINDKTYTIPTYAVHADKVPNIASNFTHNASSNNSVQTSKAGTSYANKNSFDNNYPGTNKVPVKQELQHVNSNPPPLGKIVILRNENSLSYIKNLKKVDAFQLIDKKLNQVSHIALPYLVANRIQFPHATPESIEYLGINTRSYDTGLPAIYADLQYIDKFYQDNFVRHEFFLHAQAIPVSPTYDPAYYAYASKNPKTVQQTYKQVMQQNNPINNTGNLLGQLTAFLQEANSGVQSMAAFGQNILNSIDHFQLMQLLAMIMSGSLISNVNQMVSMNSVLNSIQNNPINFALNTELSIDKTLEALNRLDSEALIRIQDYTGMLISEVDVKYL